jgi:hypothetical protein
LNSEIFVEGSPSLNANLFGFARQMFNQVNTWSLANIFSSNSDRQTGACRETNVGTWIDFEIAE